MAMPTTPLAHFRYVPYTSQYSNERWDEQDRKAWLFPKFMAE